jgi:hypothetical protein
LGALGFKLQLRMVTVALVDNPVDPSCAVEVLLEAKLHEIAASVTHRGGLFESSMQLARVHVSSPEVWRPLPVPQ